MIRTVNNITSENPTLEIWRYLRLFLNVDRGIKQIQLNLQLSDEDSKKYENAIKKQSVQVGYCIRQAEQYFQAANQVGLATRPLLLYYGCVSLSRALIMLKKDGTYSFDALRKQKKHRHHGLVLNEGKIEQAAKTKSIADFFDHLRCTCFVKDSGAPWGHFPLFYASLEPDAFILHTQTNDSDRITGIVQDLPQICADHFKIDQIVCKELRALTLLKSLPDLYVALRELGIGTDLARGNAERQILRYHRQVPEQQTELGPSPAMRRELFKIDDTHNFFVDGLTSQEKEDFKKFLTSQNDRLKVIGDLPSNLHFRLDLVREPPEFIFDPGYYPDVVEDITGKKLYILKPTEYIHEAAALLAVIFCLGMLSRYYQDIIRIFGCQ